MDAKSAQNKGKRFERFVAHQIEEAGLGKAGREGWSGAGLRKGDIASNLGFMLECKNEAQTNLLKNVDQSTAQAQKGNFNSDKWALITRDPRYPEFERVYATIDLWQFLDLLKRASEPRIKEPDRTLKYKLERLKQNCKEVINEIE